jgi:hypothetical protein
MDAIADPLLWGECQGSGSTPYRVVVTPADIGYKCTCPSRKFPCKHVLGLLWLACDAPAAFTDMSPPGWVAEWFAKRQSKPGAAQSPAPAATTDGAAVPSLSLAEAETAADEATPADPKAVQRAEAQRRRLREEREAAVLRGLDDFERWLSDQLHLGLAGFMQRAEHSLRTLSKRLVDNKVQGLASRLDMLAADIFRMPEAGREDLLLEKLAGLTLISAAYRRQDQLEPALRADVRRAVGWTMRREELLADPDAPRIASTWIVISARSEVQPDGLRRLETWLIDARSPVEATRFALLVDYVPVSVGAVATSFQPGEVIDAELVYYVSTCPLRAQVAMREPGDGYAAWPALPQELKGAIAAYDKALARQPWLEFLAFGASGIKVARAGAGQLVLDDGAGTFLPLDPRQFQEALPLVGLGPLAIAATWDGRLAALLAADTPIGVWHGA